VVQLLNEVMRRFYSVNGCFSTFRNNFNLHLLDCLILEILRNDRKHSLNGEPLNTKDEDTDIFTEGEDVVISLLKTLIFLLKTKTL
jgi:hypothetical protein